MTINDVFRIQYILVEPAGATSIPAALHSAGASPHHLSERTLDAAAHDPACLVSAIPPSVLLDRVLMIALPPLGPGGVSSVDWRTDVQQPLRRAFTAVRGLVPAFLDRLGGRVIVILPATGLLADADRTADSVLGRSLIGLAEGLRAELLGSGVTVSLVLTDPGEDPVALAGRIADARATGFFYSLPPSVSAANVSAVFTPWLSALAATPSDHALPPLGPMGEVYRAELAHTSAATPSQWEPALAEPSPMSSRRPVLIPGRTAIVTGGASGIGLGLAEALLERGMNVVIADVRDDHIAEAMTRLAGHGSRVLARHLDVTDRAAWREGASAVHDRFGSIDLLCLNAGIGVLGTVLESTPADWTWLMAVNLDGVTNGLETVLPIMRAQGMGGHVLATSSAGGLMVAGDGGIYSSAKYGVVAVMDCLRTELAPEGIGVTTLCPAGVNTNIHDHESMRPAEFSESGVRGSDDELAERQSKARDMLSHAADPASVALHVLEAVDRDDPVVFTDGGIAPVIRLRQDAIKAPIALL